MCACVCVCVYLSVCLSVCRSNDEWQHKSSLQMLANLTVVFCQQLRQIVGYLLVWVMTHKFVLFIRKLSTLPWQTQKFLLKGTVAAVGSPKAPTAAHTVLHTHTHTYTHASTPCSKKGATKLTVVTSSNLNRFSKCFHQWYERSCGWLTVYLLTF